jgi:2-keto-4-pentenoate hydratase/2-oxohepta-3-ene-1,7-dioic acid hydratase in catechol pathway
MVEWYDPAEALDVKRSDFGIVLGPVVVTPEETAASSFACRLSSGDRIVEGTPAAFSWAEALALAGHRTTLRPGDVIAGPPVVVLEGIDGDTELEVDGIGKLTCPLL